MEEEEIQNMRGTLLVLLALKMKKEPRSKKCGPSADSSRKRRPWSYKYRELNSADNTHEQGNFKIRKKPARHQVSFTLDK